VCQEDVALPRSSRVPDAGPDRAEPVTFRDVFAVPEFRALWGAGLLSLIGDQVAIVALTWLVFDRTDSPLLSAATYAITFLPWIIGGPLLTGLADRLPRRDLMVVCDVVRGVLLCAMALPGVPLWALCALLFLAELASPPFRAARAALMPDVLPGDRYVVGTAVNNITNHIGLVVGFALGGVLAAALATPVLLLINAATFTVSAALLRLQVQQRPAARAAHEGGESLLSDARHGIRLVLGRRDLRVLAGLGWLCVFFVVPEGLAVPYAAQLDGGAAAAGLLLAAIPGGAALGAVIFSRFVLPRRRLALMGPLAVLTCAPLVGFLTHPGLATAVLLLALSGAASAYMLAANAAFVAAVPPESRGAAFGLVQAVMSVGQGLSILLAGLAAQTWGPAAVIAAAGAGGCVVATHLAWSWQRGTNPAEIDRDPAAEPADAKAA